MDHTENEEWQRLEAMVDAFASEMKARLYQKKQEGYSGWDDPAQADGIAIRATLDAGRVREMEHSRKIGVMRKVGILLDDAEERRKCVDAANRLAMVWYIRGEEGR